MVIADFSGDFLNCENTNDKDIAEIIGEGENAEIEFKDRKKTVLNIPVSCNGRKKIFTPSAETGKKFVKEWGNNTSNWIGKKFQINHVMYKSFGETKKKIEGDPIKIVQV